MTVPPRVTSSSGIGVKSGIQPHVRHPRIEQAAEPLDESDRFHPAFTGPLHGAVNGGIQRGRIAPGCEDPDPFHGRSSSGERGVTTRMDRPTADYPANADPNNSNSCESKVCWRF